MENLESYLISLADEYETSDFIKNDPSFFMHQFDSAADKEISAFISASLAFGRRSQILLHAEKIFDDCAKKNESPSNWILNSSYKDFFEDSDKSFYRMFTHSSMILMCDTLKNILTENKTLGDFFKTKYNQNKDEASYRHLCFEIASAFSGDCNIIPRTDSTCAKRINMFLRWMVRDNSPVDLGLWTWFSKENLLMPLDIHVMQQSTNLGLLDTSSSGKIRSANYKTCVELTGKMKKIFPQDPVKADFALFGLGVNKS